MTIAELHGKLSSTQLTSINDRLEDLLTSDVFGTMKYAGWENGFLNWILKAVPASIKPLPPPIENYLRKEKVLNIDYSFWPKLKNMRELDVGLLLNFNVEKYLFIGIEAKYFSGTSDWDNLSEAVPVELTGNQIADHVQGINDMSADEIFKLFSQSLPSNMKPDEFDVHRIYIFLTAHMAVPINDFEYANKHLHRNWPTPSYWLSWNNLASCLKPYQDHLDKRTSYLISDLYNLLKRKELIPFDGFKMTPWYTNTTAPNFWIENWFLQQGINIPTNKSFWKNYRF